MNAGAEPARDANATVGRGRVGDSRWETYGPWLVVVATVAFGLIELRAQTRVVPYLNDNTLDGQMARFASARISAGHLPLTSWYPDLGLGSPQFLHYQSLGATVVGLIGMRLGVNATFAWSTYLLVASWPLSVFIGARLLGRSRWVAAMSALVSPFVASATMVGFEPQSYLWVGYGVWAQLCAMWTLPLAWGFTWRAMESRRYLLPSTVLVSLTVALHFMTGYLALAGLVIMPLVSRADLRRRLGRAGLLALGVALTSAVVVLPLVRFGSWASVNEFLQGTPSADSYGAKQVMGWLVTGQLFDQARLPVLTLLVAIGLLAGVARMRGDPVVRAILGLFVVSLVLFFGRRTFGAAIDIVPGASDLFFRRFIEGVQLSGILLAGQGAVTIFETGARAIRRVAPPSGSAHPRWRSPMVTRSAVVLVGLAYLAPAWTQLAALAQSNGSAIAIQADAMGSQGVELDALIARIHTLGPGRVYAGMTTNWGMQFTVGEVPVLKYLAFRDVDEVGYTLRTASLMTDPEAYFNETNPSDYALFGVRYLILPLGRVPLVPARLIARSGPYVLWEIPAVHLVEVIDTIGTVTESRVALGRQSAWVLASNLPSLGRYLTVAFNGGRAPLPTVTAGVDPVGPPGSVVSEVENLAAGSATARVVARRRAVVLLKVSYDPGWTATLDGHRASVEMIAPALVGVVVPPGAHEVQFEYRSDAGYPLLFGLGVLGLVFVAALSFGDVVAGRRRNDTASRPTRP